MALQTFTWYPDVGAEQAIKPRVVMAKFGDGYEQRMAQGINTQPATWSLTFTRARTEGMAILAFLAARGGVEAFNWTTPHSVAGVYICREWRQQQLRPNIFVITATFEQVFEN